MKKTILGLMPLLVASMLIAGCGKKAESSSAAPSSSEPSSSSEPISYTVDSVLASIGSSIWGSKFDPAWIEDDENNPGWKTFHYALTFDKKDETTEFDDATDGTEAILSAGLSAVVSMCEEGLLTVAEGYPKFIENAIGGSINVCDAYYLVPDESVVVNIYDYVYDSDLWFVFGAAENTPE